jgi:hypothetical protein
LADSFRLDKVGWFLGTGPFWSCCRFLSSFLCLFGRTLKLMPLSMQLWRFQTRPTFMLVEIVLDFESVPGRFHRCCRANAFAMIVTICNIHRPVF